MTHSLSLTPAAFERAILRLKQGPLTVTEMAKLSGLPGPTDGARAQRLRRLEARGVLPPARRSLAKGDRYYGPQDAENLRVAILKAIPHREE